VSTLYVICQSEMYFPGIESWIADAWLRVLPEEPEHGWTYKLIKADANNTFHPLHAYSLIGQDRGPVLVVGAIKQAPIAVLTSKLMLECVVSHLKAPNGTEHLCTEMCEILRRHQQGEPYVPLRYAAAVQIFRKLQKHKYWGGEALNKSFIWASDLPKGRGITDAIAPHVLLVANELATRNLLKTKHSRGDLKYALDRDGLPTVNAIFERNWLQLDKGLQTWLMNSENTVPATEVREAVDGWVYGSDAQE
jgi:hypothetical protein